jgi:hypothetical protein
MPLSLNEIRKRATEFSKEWENTANERANAQTFWNEFFNVFGVSRRRVATFEEPVRKPDGQQGYIDLLWKRTVLVEHKSRGRDLATAYNQAKEYFPGLRDEDLPRYIVVSDFQRIKLYDLEASTDSEFKLIDLAKNINLFGFISGYQQRTYKDQAPVNIQAAELMGELHDTLLANGYTGHELEVMLVRLLFCLFAEDAIIFDKQQFTDYIELRTKEDGSDLGIQLAQLFQVLDTPPERRLKNLDEQLAAFEYVNGSLFSEQLHFATFDSTMRKKLLACCYFDWSLISPAIFGSMFQHVMDTVDAKHRRELGAHYTSERNILKLIKGLFLDQLWQEFEAVKSNKARLEKFHDKISKLKFLDPACGCGNFLIITYRELRLLEIEILKTLFKGQLVTDVKGISKVDVDAFYGIEYEEFPAQIATVAMWLCDHQMNMRLSQEFGEYYKRLPLRKSATIVHGNALRLNWEDIVQNDSLSYILGNPPFGGHHYQKPEQKEDVALVFSDLTGSGVLDYVSCWFAKAAKFIDENSSINNPISCAFVSTNSISQGEQVGILWSYLFAKYKLKIHFAHRTFKWSNEAKGNAAVHCVIIGFSNFDVKEKMLFEYAEITSEPHAKKVRNINPFLVQADDILVLNRSEPICKVPRMLWGNKPTDGGNFILSPEEKVSLLKVEPLAEKWIKRYVGGEDLINNLERYCLWLKDIKPNELRALPSVMLRVEGVKQMRLASKAATTRKKALTPTLFSQIAQPDSNYLAVPEVSSERRTYIPISFVSSAIIASNTVQIVPNATLFHFGVLTSEMHMTWMRYVCGRLKSDYRYSNTIVYNNFPWPEDLPSQKINGVDKLAEQILKIRQRYPESTLADLYDPTATPPDLMRAHRDLDKFVDTCYRSQPFDTEMQRIEFLFDLYKKYTQPLFGSEKKKRVKKSPA